MSKFWAWIISLFSAKKALPAPSPAPQPVSPPEPAPAPVAPPVEPAKPVDQTVSDEPTLRDGNSGNAVLALQKLLIKAGFKLKPDGQFGPATEAAVKAFQSVHGLTVDGVAGSSTWQALTEPPSPAPAPAPSPKPVNWGPVVVCPHTVLEYTAKYAAAKIHPVHEAAAARWASAIERFQSAYEVVETATGIPWQLVGAIHVREASQDFKTYLQNGDPLWNSDGRGIPTVHEPRGVGPFSPQTWPNAAIHALGGAGANKGITWTVGRMLMFAEAYNGLGYRDRGICDPYNFAWTDQYVKGKYNADGHFVSSAVDEQPGVAAIFIAMGLAPS